MTSLPLANSRVGTTPVCFRDWFAQTPAQYTSGRDPARRMKLAEFPQFVADELGMPFTELWSVFFDDISPAYCASLAEAAAKAGVSIDNIQLDAIDADLASLDNERRDHSVEVVKQWMDRAALIGAPSVRANADQPTAGRPFDPDRIADSYRRLAEYGDRIGVDILVENHFGYTAQISNVMAIHERVAHPRFGLLADWGNSPAETTEARIADLSHMFGDLRLVEAKAIRFDEDYNHLNYDIGAIVRATEASGYTGKYAVELFTLGDAMPLDPVRAIQSVAATIRDNLRAADASAAIKE
ncbi:sugar phosphate isomerase/epimerase family protein [Sphingopyxis sp.]|uniref:sugar phosphate isomerase/epimerase family protein n=1 Tax=Sphingopyxis sp. TaxID=1908224 RepID=UPI002DE7B2EE|nr:TIM barrel protein [Sphingopyxis sp.]